MSTSRRATRSAAILAGFALVSAALIAATYQLTAERIAANQRAAERDKLHSILAPDAYDNDLIADSIEVTAPDRLGSPEPLTVYRARRNGDPVAAILTVVAPDGYNGPIRLLVGIHRSGRVIGVRVLEHNETPGLGDGIENDKTDWLKAFHGKDLDDPAVQDWAVRQDGGAYDALSGATVTSRAVVNAIRRALSFFKANRQRLLAPQ
jgi:electron transport complex protein RnfG